MSDSIFDIINSAVGPDGKLPEDFSLPKLEDAEQAVFADGALDGIQIYHVSFPVLEESDKDEIYKLLKIANDREFEKAAEGFAEFCKKYKAIELIDEIQKPIIEHQDELWPQEMSEFAYELIACSSDRELVKVGLIIMELIDTSDDPVLMQIIKTLGLSDEFTIFSAFIMRHWPDGQMELLELAKKVRGWGRIHSVRILEPVNDEIYRWLLLNGIDNDVMPEYSALALFEKLGIEEMLDRTDLDTDEIKGILKIVGSMLKEGPVLGISAVDSPPEVLEKVMALAQRSELDEEGNRIAEEIKELLSRFGGDD